MDNLKLMQEKKERDNSEKLANLHSMEKQIQGFNQKLTQEINQKSALEVKILNLEKQSKAGEQKLKEENERARQQMNDQILNQENQAKVLVQTLRLKYEEQLKVLNDEMRQANETKIRQMKQLEECKIKIDELVEQNRKMAQQTSSLPEELPIKEQTSLDMSESNLSVYQLEIGQRLIFLPDQPGLFVALQLPQPD